MDIIDNDPDLDSDIDVWGPVKIDFSFSSSPVRKLKISCVWPLIFKSTLLFRSEHLNVFVYVENSVFFKYRRVVFNFKMHVKNLNSIFENFEISAPLQ